jgi:hypothetical protein
MLDLPVNLLNQKPLNASALSWLRKAGEVSDPGALHLLTLANWGVEQGLAKPILGGQAYVLEGQVGELLGWNPRAAMDWLVSNRNGPSPEGQELELLVALEAAESPRAAATLVLRVILDAQIAATPSLQPAASELS